MDTILQNTFPNAFSCIKVVLFWLKFCWDFFPRVHLQESNAGSDNVLNRRQAITWTSSDLLLQFEPQGVKNICENFNLDTNIIFF